jgi:hypothetical protein
MKMPMLVRVRGSEEDHPKTFRLSLDRARATAAI